MLYFWPSFGVLFLLFPGYDQRRKSLFSSSPKVCSSSLVDMISLAFYSNTSCSKSRQNGSPCSKATFIKCLFLPVALPTLFMTFKFLHSESSSLASLHSIVCFGLGSSIVFWMGFCLVGPSLTVGCCSTWSLGVPNSSSTLFSSKIDMFEVSLGPLGEVVGSIIDSLSEELYFSGCSTRRQGCTLTYVPPCLTRTCLCSHLIAFPSFMCCICL